MKELLKFLVENLVKNKDAIEIREEETDRGMTIYLKVDPEDMGRVIGRKGRVANSLRTILRSSKLNNGKIVHLEIEG